MANFYGNPMVLDTVWTAGTIPTTADANGNAAPGVKASPVNAKKIVWTGGTTAGDTCVIADINSDVIVSATMGTNNVNQDLVVWQSDEKTLPLKMQKWVLLTLTHGKCQIFY